MPYNYVNNDPFGGAAGAFAVWQRQGGRATQEDIDNIGNDAYFQKKYGDFGTSDIYDRIKQARADQEAAKIKNLRKQQQQQYDSFKTNLGKYKENTFGLIQAQEQKRLNQELSQNARGFNQRGLLYSGLRQGADARSRVQSTTNLAEARQSVNQQYDQQLDQMRTKAINTGFNIQANQQMIADMAYQQALENMASRKSAMGNMLGIAGGIVGGIYGGPVGAAGGAAVGQGVGQMVG